jgi:sulfonate transport system permease protein
MSAAEQNHSIAWKDSAEVARESVGSQKEGLVLPDWLLGWIVPVVSLILWELLARTGVLPPNWLPAPTSVELWKHVGITLARVVAGFLIGAAAGTLLGALTGYVRIACKLLDPLLQSLRSVPSIAWVPLFLLWLGIQETSKIALISLGAFFPVYLNLSAAVRDVDPKLIEVGRLYRLNGFEMIRRLILPAVLPQYIVGLRSGLGLAWMFVVAAELLGSSSGIGYLMVDGQMTGRAAIIFASIILFAACGKVTDWIANVVGDTTLGHRAR